MSGPTSATFEDSDEDLVQGPVTRSRGKLLENLGSLISLSKRSVTFADSNERKSRTSTKGEKKRQKRARSPSRSASPPPQKVLHTLSTISEGFEGPSVSRTESSRSGSRKPGSRSRSGSSPAQDHAPDLAQDLVVEVARTTLSLQKPNLALPMTRRQAQAKQRSRRSLLVPVSLRQLRRTAEKSPERRAVGRQSAPSHPKKSLKPQLSPKNCGK